MLGAEGLVIMALCLAGGLIALVAYYIAVHDKITSLVSEKVVLGFISSRRYSIKSELKRSEVWSELATDANEMVQAKYQVKNYFSTEEIESLLNQVIDIKKDFSHPMREPSEDAGWQSVLVIAKNIHNEDKAAYWASRIPEDVMKRYGRQV